LIGLTPGHLSNVDLGQAGNQPDEHKRIVKSQNNLH